MPMTFGSALTTSVQISGPANVDYASSPMVCLIAFWMYPTTITSGRSPWGLTGATKLAWSGTAGEMAMTIDMATTDAVFTTTNLVAATNEWRFVAFLYTAINAGAATACRAWAGTANTPPVELTLTATTAGAGNVQTGVTGAYIGNNSGISSAFQGDIGPLTLITSSGTGAASTFNVETGGAISQAEADLCLSRWVVPLWLGRPDSAAAVLSGATDNVTIMHAPLDNRPSAAWTTVYYNARPAAGVPFLAASSQWPSFQCTVNGASTVPSANRAPIESPHNWPMLAPFMRR